MESADSKRTGRQIRDEGDPPDQPPPLSQKPPGGLKRMQGLARLPPKIYPKPKEPSSQRSPILNHSSSMAALPFGQSSSSFLPNCPGNIMSNPKSNLTRIKTSIGPLKYEYPERESSESEKVKKMKSSCSYEDRKSVSPVKQLAQKPPGGTFMSEFFLPENGLTRQKMPVINSNDYIPRLQRSSSGGMLLRKAPKKKKHYDEISPPNSAHRKVRKSGSLQLAQNEKVTEKPTSTPMLKRLRTASITTIFPNDNMPVLTPQARLRPRTSSESRTEELKSPLKRPTDSPMKKRPRFDSGSAPPSPLKKRYTSTATIRLGERGNEPATLTVTPQSSLRRNKSTAAVRTLLSERIAQTYGTERKQKQLEEIPETMGQSSSKREPPKLVIRSTSGDSYYTANEEDEQALTSSSVPIENPTEKEKVLKEDVFVTPRNSLQDGEMVPLVKKQMSIDDKIMEDEEDEGFGDSTKTIKRGQGAALARSLSLKLSPRKDQQKPIGADTEKSCSTPSLPTAPLLRQGSASSLRFKVSPSTFLKFNISPVVSSPPVVSPATPVVPLVAFPTSPSDLRTPTEKVAVEELSEPSTSTTMPKESTPETTKTKKSALRKPATQFVVREDHLVPAYRHRSVRYDGLKVYYFDRKQGETTVPTEGEVSLAMHDKHHAHRYFPLTSGKRPKLDLQLYSDEDLSDGEVITPDDDEHDYEEYSSARTILQIAEKTRMRLLKKSGIQADKSGATAQTLRTIRHQCGCSCENGICLPETCQCAIDGIECQVDGGDYPSHPCVCFVDKCKNPNGRIFYDQDAVRDHRTRAIMNWKAGQKTGFSGSPTIKKFVDSDDEDGQNGKKKSWLLKSAIPLKLEESPLKYPVTPVYTRRSRSSLSDIRESTSESNCLPAPSTSLAERMKLAQHLENETCVEEEEKEEDTEKDDNVSLEEVYVEPNTDSVIENELETTMSPVKATLVA